MAILLSANVRRPLPLGLLLLFSFACGGSEPTDTAARPNPDLERQEARAANVTILRDDFGVPHVYGTSDADTVFGLLYAQSEDDFARVERNYVWAIGRLAEVEGEEALISDLRARLYMTRKEAEAAYDSAPPWLQELCIAWADGINYYLHTHPEVQPKLLDRFEPWMPMYFFEGSIGGDIEQIPLDGIRDFYTPLADGGALPQAEVASFDSPSVPRFLAPDRADDEPRGSNGFAIDGSRTRSGKAMLLINPHTSFYFRGEVHAVSEEGLNAYGAVTWGQFFIYQGFNENTGWMHTSTRVDFIDEFALDVDLGTETPTYRYGDERRPLEVGEVTLRYKDGDGFGERTFPTYHSHHGPITHRLGDDAGELAGRWVATKINWDPVNALRQSYLRTKTSSYEDFLEVMQIRTNSSNNTVYADSGGNIAYFHGNFVPRRDPSFDYQQPVDGSDPRTDWQGLHEVSETVSLLNPDTGWLQNANSTPFTAAGPASPLRQDYPVYMAPDFENFRGVQAVRLLEETQDMTLDRLIELAYHPGLPAFEVLMPSVVEAWDRSGGTSGPHADLESPVEALRIWNHQVSADSVAMSLAHFFGLQVLRHGEIPDSVRGRMQRIEHFASESPDNERLEHLAAVVAKLDADFGSWETPWGDINRFQRLDGEIDSRFDDNEPSLPVAMASGRWGALASYGARAKNTKRIYGSSGNSFVAVVEFGDRLRAKSLLAGGQSGDPSSPHFDDQAQRYVDRRFKEVAYYREDVERRATRTYRPGEEL